MARASVARPLGPEDHLPGPVVKTMTTMGMGTAVHPRGPAVPVALTILVVDHLRDAVARKPHSVTS
jgi:hypothetical protein